MEEFVLAMERKVLPKGTILLYAGSMENHITFVESGMLRGVHYAGGREITTWFGLPGKFCASYYSLIGRVPSVENVEAVEDTIAYKLSYTKLQEFYDLYPECERMGRRLAELCYVDLANRMLAMQFSSAHEKYQYLLTISPEIIRRAPLKYIAQYLGITQETLSRVRASM